MSDAMGALCHLTLQYLDWLAKQLMPDTAETEWLDRHGNIWLTNADGTTGRKLAALAEGSATLIGAVGTYVPQATQLSYGTVGYETQEVIYLTDAPTPVAVRALDPGTQGNRLSGDVLNLESTDVPGITGEIAVVTMDGGTDEETDDELRYRVLKRIREPPMGGDKTDYEQWALAVSGCTRAWASPLEMGMGTVSVRVMFDDLRASEDGFPHAEDLQKVSNYLDTVRPVAVKDYWVLSPIRQRVDVSIANLNPDNAAVRAGIETSLHDMIFEKATPGQTIYASWKSYAIMTAPNVISFDLTNNADDVMPSPGHMAVLGDIYYDKALPV
jgi:uncharacterized phage protein gp47/JayE